MAAILGLALPLLAVSRPAIQRFVDDGLTVIVLCNRADLDATGLALKVAGFYLADGK